MRRRLCGKVTLGRLSSRKAAHGKNLPAAFVDSSTDAIFSKSFDGVITSWNRAAERLFGFSTDEIAGTSMLRLIPESRREEESRRFERLNAGERVAAFQTVRMRKDGTEIDVSVTISPIKDEQLRAQAGRFRAIQRGRQASGLLLAAAESPAKRRRRPGASRSRWRHV